MREGTELSLQVLREKREERERERERESEERESVIV